MQTILTSTATTVQHTTLKGDLIKVEGIGPGGSGSAKVSNTRGGSGGGGGSYAAQANPQNVPQTVASWVDL
jgi:hypothetical protein